LKGLCFFYESPRLCGIHDERHDVRAHLVRSPAQMGLDPLTGARVPCIQ
jgi:hypothetical protein